MPPGKALTKGLDILEALAASDDALAFAELRGRVDVSPASFARFLRILCERGYAVQSSGGYRLGWSSVKLGLAAREMSSVRELARPHLEEIAAATDESSELAVFESDEFIFLDRVECPRSVVLKARPGSSFPIRDGTAIGRLAIAMGCAPRRGGLAARAAKRVRHDLFAEMLQNDDEVYRSAAPIFGSGGGCIGCICVAAPAFRVGERERKAFRRLLGEHSRELSAKLGAREETAARHRVG